MFFCIFNDWGFFFSNHVIWIVEDLVETNELASRLLLDTDYIVLLGAIDNLEVSPWTFVLIKWRCVLAAKELRKLFLVDILEQCLLIAAALDLNLLSRLLIEPSFDDSPNHGEGFGSIHDHHLPELLGIEVLGNL